MREEQGERFMPRILKKIRQFLTAPELLYSLLLFFITRSILIVIGAVSSLALMPMHGKEFLISTKHLWLNIWALWDSGWYLGIAANGYSPVVYNGPETWGTSVAFFPLYPLLVRIVSAVIGSGFAAGLLVSNVSLLVACLFLYKLVRLDSDHETSLRSVKYLFLFPNAFIFSGIFTESLFLALAITCFYYVKKNDLARAGTAGFFAALTRSPGVLLVMPLTFSYLREKGRRLRPELLYLLLIPLGLSVFAAYNYYLTGDPLAFAHAQAVWKKKLSNPVTVLVGSLSSPDIATSFSGYFTLVCLLAIFLSVRKMEFAYFFFCLYSIAVPLTAGTVLSMPRYCLILFPLCIVLAKVGRDPRLDQLMVISLCLLQGFMMVFWNNAIMMLM